MKISKGGSLVIGTVVESFDFSSSVSELHLLSRSLESTCYNVFCYSIQCMFMKLLIYETANSFPSCLSPNPNPLEPYPFAQRGVTELADIFSKRKNPSPERDPTVLWGSTYKTPKMMKKKRRDDTLTDEEDSQIDHIRG